MKEDGQMFPELPEEGTQVLAKISGGGYRVLESYLETPTYEETFKAFLYWDDPHNDGQVIEVCDAESYVALDEGMLVSQRKIKSVLDRLENYPTDLSCYVTLQEIVAATRVKGSLLRILKGGLS